MVVTKNQGDKGEAKSRLNLRTSARVPFPDKAANADILGRSPLLTRVRSDPSHASSFRSFQKADIFEPSTTFFYLVQKQQDVGK